MIELQVSIERWVPLSPSPLGVKQLIQVFLLPILQLPCSRFLGTLEVAVIGPLEAEDARRFQLEVEAAPPPNHDTSHNSGLSRDPCRSQVP